jgi:hypothetical protein
MTAPVLSLHRVIVRGISCERDGLEAAGRSRESVACWMRIALTIMLILALRKEMIVFLFRSQDKG